MVDCLMLVRRFSALLIKNYYLRKRHYIITAIELIIPLLLVLPALWLKPDVSSYSSEYAPQDWSRPAEIFPVSHMDQNKPDARGKYVYFVPNNSETKQFVDEYIDEIWPNKPRNYITRKRTIQTIGFDTESEMKERILAEALNGTIYDVQFGIVFNKFSTEEIDYTLYVSAHYYGFHPGSDLYSMYQTVTQSAGYELLGILYYQNKIDRKFMKTVIKSNKTFNSFKVGFQSFPAPPLDSGVQMQSGMVMIVTLLIGLSLIFFVMSLISRICIEKNSGMKEFLKMMGMNSCMYWSSWFVNGFVFAAVVFLLMIGILSINVPGYMSVFNMAHKFILIIFFFFYAVSTVLFCFAISVFFPRALFGCLFALVVWLASLLLPIFTFGGNIVVLNISSSTKLYCCLIPNFALYLGVDTLLNLNANGQYLDWETISKEVSEVCFNQVLLVMFLSWIMYTVIIWYFEAVWPFQKGVPRPFYFLFTRSYWCGYKSMQESNDTVDDSSPNEYFEMSTTNRHAGVNIKNLSKTFYSMSGKKVAVDNVSLKIYHGEITALLGHNGAGKTTTISIMSGMITPSKGTVFVEGNDIRTNLSQARSSMGFCPQESILFNELTVREHLHMISKLKGCPSAEIDSDLENVATAVQINEKLDAVASTLSGGMKRKLSLAMAMVGKSQVLLLDEPTSGMDPEARRKVWDMLLSLRHEKTILLTTHYMEEADALGDTIAIMTHGKIFCCGSPLFLKDAFDAGYHLRMIKKDDCKVVNVLNALNKFIPVKVERDFGQELSLLIETSDLSKFPAMFKMLEADKDQLGIANFGLSVTNMEDVFLRVGNMVESEKMDNEETSKHQILESVRETATVKFYKNLTGVLLFFTQLFGLLCKRFHQNRRQYIAMIFVFVFPFLMCYMAFSISSSVARGSVLLYPKRDIDLSLYSPTKVYYNLTGNFASKYKQIVRDGSWKPIPSGKVMDDLLHVAITNAYEYKYDYAMAAYQDEVGFEDLHVVAYNPLAIYSPMISLNTVNNAFLKSQGSLAKIKVAMNFFRSSFYFYPPEFIYAISGSILPIGFTVLTTFCAMFIINERVSKSKHLQIMTNLNRFTFWVGHLIYDITFCMVVFLPIIILMACDTGIFNRTSESMGGILMAMILYATSGTLFSYVMSFIFPKAVVGFVIISTFCNITTILMVILSMVLKHTLVFDSFKKAQQFFRLIPTFPFVKIVTEIQFENASLDECTDYRKFCDGSNSYSSFYTACCSNYKEFDPFEHLSDDYHMLVADCIIYAVLLFLIELPFIKNIVLTLFDNIFIKKKLLPQNRTHSKDEDVESSNLVVEEAITDEGNMDDYALVAHNLTKRFWKILAVNNLTFGVPKDQCFGLLGVNGAGKTTTFSMLTGDIRMTSGNAYIKNISLKKNRSAFQEKIGYCPQFDAHLDKLTAEELLYLFARLRGVPSKDTKKVVDALVQMVDLSLYSKKVIGTYSGGNKRKLSIAISMIGLPSILFLDEPTAGIDPFARRQIWNLISSIKAAGISVVLTSHSMEECEALCDNLSIMVDGEFKCYGSITHLKNKFGQGFTIEAKQKVLENESADASTNLDKIKAKIVDEITSATLKEEHQGVLTYHVGNVDESWANMFSTMEKLRTDQMLENYSISATSLEQVFLSFAAMKNPGSVKV